MKVPNSPDSDADTESSPSDNIPWTRPGKKGGEEPELAHESDMIPTLEHPKLPDSEWWTEEILRTFHQPYNDSPEALEHMLREQARYPPVLIAHIKGTHIIKQKKMKLGFKPVDLPPSPRGLFGERLPRSPTQLKHQLELNADEEENVVEDFEIKIDMTYLLAQLPSFSVPPSPRFAIPKHLRPQLHAVADGVKAMRGGMFIRRRWPDSSAFRPGEDALKFWFREYVNKSTTFCRKRFVFTRKVTNFDSDRLRSMIEGIIRSTNYRGRISIDFVTTKTQLVVTHRTGFVAWLHESPFWWCFIYFVLGPVLFWAVVIWVIPDIDSLKTPFILPIFLLLCIFWILFWPSLLFRVRDYQVIYAEFPFGSDLKNRANFSQGQETYISGSRIVRRTGNYVATAEQQFSSDWKHAIRRGVRECYRGGMDTNYLVESNDLYEDFGARLKKSKMGAMSDKWGTDDIRGMNDKPWGMDEERPITFDLGSKARLRY